MHNAKRRTFLFYMLLLMVLTGCGTLPGGKGWGEGATYAPGWNRVGQAALGSIASPWTWGPAAGAILFRIDGWDEKLTNWASENTPIFGSKLDASNYGDYLLYASGAAYALTALAAPSGNEAGEWMTNKMKGFIVGGVAIGLAEAADGSLNKLVTRHRPDCDTIKAFPSGHATIATSFATLASKNLAAMELPSTTKTAANIGLGLISVGTAWSRLEADRHRPSDVLAGISIGHFISAFVSDALLGTDRPADITPEARLIKNGFLLKVRWKY